MNKRSKNMETSSDSDELWDARLNGKKLKSSMMRTYSKKTPYLLLSATKKHDEEGSVLSKSEQETWDHVLRNTPRKTNLKRSIARKFSNLVDSCKKKNKTSVSLASMSPCTVLNSEDTRDNDVDLQPMSLCSIVGTGGKIPTVMTVNSTLLTNSNDVDSNFVPDDISVIEGDNHNAHQTMNDEWSIINQGLESGPSTKKVKFSVRRIGQKSKVNYHGPVSTPGRSILKMPLQPLLESDSDETSPDFNGDITPETCNPAKSCSGSAKQRRRLSYHDPADDVPRCILLDLPVSKKKKAKVLWRKSPDLIKPEDINLFPTDILITCKK